MGKRLWTILPAVLSVLCLGCSGNNVPGIIHSHAVYSRWHAAFFGMLVALSALAWRQSKRLPLYPRIFLGLLVLHPAWWQSGYSGDCGIGKADNSFSWSIMGGLFLIVQILHLSPPKIRWTVAAALGILALSPILVLGTRPAPVQTAAEVGLLDAADHGDLPKVQALISQGTKVDTRRRSEPPTRWEPLENAWTKLRWPDYPLQQGFTPLMLACMGGHRSTAEFLLDHGANVNATSEEGGRSVVDLASGYDHPDLVPLLVQHGAHSDPHR